MALQENKPSTTNMKKGDTIQLTVIILAFIIGFGAFRFFIDAAVNLLIMISMDDVRSYFLAPVIVTVIVTLLQVVLCWLLLMRSAKIAAFIYEKTGIGTSFKIVSQPNDLLYILFIIVAFYFLLENLPVLIKGLVNAFRSKASSRFDAPEYDSNINWTALFIKLLVPAILLMAARPIANYFANNVTEEPVIAGEDMDAINENEMIHK